MGPLLKDKKKFLNFIFITFFSARLKWENVSRSNLPHLSHAEKKVPVFQNFTERNNQL